MRSNMLKVETPSFWSVLAITTIGFVCIFIGGLLIHKGIIDYQKAVNEQEYINYAIQDSKMQHENLM